MPALLLPDIYVGHTGSILPPFLKCLCPTDVSGRAHSQGWGTHRGLWRWAGPRLAAGEGGSGAPHPAHRCFATCKTCLRARTAHSSPPQLRVSSFCTKIPLPDLTAPCARHMRLTGEKNLLLRNQHACCFHIKPAPAIPQYLLSSIPSPGTELYAAQSCPTAGPDPLRSDVGTPFFAQPPLLKSHRGKTKAERFP